MRPCTFRLHCLAPHLSAFGMSRCATMLSTARWPGCDSTRLWKWRDTDGLPRQILTSVPLAALRNLRWRFIGGHQSC